MNGGLSRIALTLIIGLFIFCGCAGGGNPSTVVAPVDATGINAQTASSHSCWGLWQFTADPVNETLDVVPLRLVDMHLNAIPFLEPPANLYLTIESLAFNGDIIDVDIGLRHPFLGLTKFTGFDVCGVFISSGNQTGFDDPDLVMAGEGDTRLMNPDGLTRWWNPAEFPVNDGTIFSYKDGMLGTPDLSADYNCTLNGYKYFCDDLDDLYDPMSEVTSENRGYFSAGQKNVRHYTIKMESGLVFNYAVDASWKMPIGSSPWTVPDDFPSGANRTEAWNVSVTEINNALFHNNEGSGGALSLSIDVYDWVNAGLNTVRVESPGNFDSAFSDIPIGGGEGYSTYEIDITDAYPITAGMIDLLITVESEAEGYQGLLPGKSISAYFPYQTTVASGTQPVVGDLSFYWECPGDPCPGHIITFEISEAYDPGGADVTIDWDFDGDFDYADDLDGDDTNLMGEYIFPIPGFYDAWCRVDNGLTYVDVGPFAVTVIECLPDAPEVVNTINPTDPATSYNVDYADGYVYMTYSNGGSTGDPNGLYIFDVDPIETASQVGYVETSHMPQAVAYKDGYCYIAGVYLLGIITVDVDPPESAHIVDTDDAVLANGFVNEAVIYGDYLYFAAQWSALMIYDISTPDNPVFQGKVGPTPNHEYCAAVDVSPDKSYAFITWGYEINPEMDDYLHIVDISDPTNPSIELSLDIPYNASSLVVDGDWCYVLVKSNMHVFNIENPLAAYEETSITVMSGLQDISIDGNYAYCVNFKTSPWSGQMAVVDISDPTAPVVETTIDLTGIAFGIDNHCGIGYAAVGNGLDIIELY